MPGSSCGCSSDATLVSPGGPRRCTPRAWWLVSGTALVLLLGGPPDARAQGSWPVHVMPAIGIAFGGETNIADPDSVTGLRKTTWGGAVGFFGPGVFGVEADFAYTHRFFEDDDPSSVVASSSVVTLTGNLLVLTPLAWTGYSLRPYVVGGLGLIRAQKKDRFPSLVDLTSNMAGIDVGGGAVGFVSARVGLRWDIRYFRTTSRPDADEAISLGPPSLRFWRANVALVIR